MVKGRKTRQHKFYEYEEKYGNIPEDYVKRLQWMTNEFNLSNLKKQQILDARQDLMENIKYKTYRIVLYEEPEGTPRPRFRIVNRYNLTNPNIRNSQFVHVYSLTGKEDSKYMKELVTEGEFKELENILYTPCRVEFSAYVRTPKSFNIKEMFLAEIGLIRPINKPDWDNIGKKYSDMFNSNIWLDDTLVIDGTVRKFYSIKPRVEVDLLFLDKLYNKYQYNSTITKIDEFDINKEDIDYYSK